jgi:general secretion pathway protein L
MDLKQQQQGMDTLKKFWDWWSSELSQLAPRGLSHYFSKNAGMLSVYLEGDVAQFQFKTESGSRVLGVTDLAIGDDKPLSELKNNFLVDIPDGVSVNIYLSSEQLLVSEQWMPLATEGNLENVLKYEIDRLTPFQTEQVSYGYQVKERYPENDKIKLELHVLQATYLEKLLFQLKYLGLVPDAIWPTLNDEKSLTPTQNLLPVEQRPAVESIWNHKARQFGVTALILLLAVLIFPAYQFDQKISRLEQRIADVREPAVVVGSKQSLLDSRLAAQDTLIQRKNLSPGKLNIIHEVTGLLPDNTWVSRLKVSDQGVNLRGESLKASDLIELLEKSEQFKNVVFVSPITRNASTNMERYEIRMELGGDAQ